MKSVRTRQIGIALFSAFFAIYSLSAIDNAHFFKAPRFHGERHFKTKDWLFMADATYANGSTYRGRNDKGDKVGAFNIHGYHNLWYLTSGVCDPSGISTDLQKIITDLSWTRTEYDKEEAHVKVGKDTFGHVEFSGKFEVDELDFRFRQNLIDNVFIELDIPVRRIKVSKMTMLDKTPTSTKTATSDPTADLYTLSDSRWTDFLTSFTNHEILAAYGLKNYDRGYKKYYFGDISLLLGWMYHKKDPVDFLDYFNLAVKAGVLFPTGHNADPHHPFGLPTAYNGHFAFPIRLDVLFGLSKDICVGGHLGVMFFTTETHKHMRVKTHANQNGFIKLAQAKVSEKKGTLLDLGAYLKLDHFFKGLSGQVAYSYNRREKDKLHVLDAYGNCVNNNILDTDKTLRPWEMHVIHFLAEYDFGAHSFFKKRKWQPRFSLFYDYPFDGRNIFVTPLTGGTIGTDLSWRF